MHWPQEVVRKRVACFNLSNIKYRNSLRQTLHSEVLRSSKAAVRESIKLVSNVYIGKEKNAKQFAQSHTFYRTFWRTPYSQAALIEPQLGKDADQDRLDNSVHRTEAAPNHFNLTSHAAT